jgi:hypothetical protein
MTTKPRRIKAAHSYRSFPFRPGKKPGSANIPQARDALEVFAVLYEAYHSGRLTEKQLQPLFFRSTSDLISYREGWKAGKFWSRDAWKEACRNGNTNKLVSEHVLPRSVTLNAALKRPLEQAKEFVWAMSFECVVTRPENRSLPRDTGYPDDPWRRYAEAGIRVLDVHYDGQAFLSDDDRAPLLRHGILVHHA